MIVDSDSDDQPLVKHRDSDSDEEAIVTPKAPKKQRIHPPPNSSKVHFQLDEDHHGIDDSPYSASHDTSPKYSGNEDNAPLSRSPHHLRSKKVPAPKLDGKRKRGKH